MSKQKRVKRNRDQTKARKKKHKRMPRVNKLFKALGEGE